MSLCDDPDDIDIELKTLYEGVVQFSNSRYHDLGIDVVRSCNRKSVE